MSSPSTQRNARLAALGVTPLRLRSRDAVAEPGQTEVAVQSEVAVQPGATMVPCVLLLPETCSPRSLDLVGRAMRAFGADYARAPRIQVPASGLRDAPPAARAFLAFGEAQARALGQVLSAEAMRETEVVLLDMPEHLVQGAAKQRLWQAMKALRNRLRVH